MNLIKFLSGPFVIGPKRYRQFHADREAMRALADGQKHWDETADALARIEEDNEVLEPHLEPGCLICRRLGRRCIDHQRKDVL